MLGENYVGALSRVGIGSAHAVQASACGTGIQYGATDTSRGADPTARPSFMEHVSATNVLTATR